MSAVTGSLRVRLLGGLAVEGLTDAAVGSRKARTLVKVLALARGAPVAASVLADILWDDRPPARPVEQIGVLVSRLRKVLGAERISRSEAGFALHADWLDLDELAALVDQAAGAVREGRLAAARAASSAALALARGDLLPDDDGSWLEADRARAARAVSRARGLAAEAALRAGDLVAAELAATSALAADPYDEVALRCLMRAQVAGGRPASALATYARTRTVLADELGVSPSEDTEALHAAVLLGTAAHEAVPAASDVRLVGRDRELHALEDHLASARRVVRVVAVVGEPGIGKTALVQWFTDCVRDGGTRTLLGRVDELGRDLPLQPIVDALRDGGVASALRRSNGASTTTMPDTDTARARDFRLVLDELTGAPSGTVLVLDDVHLADAATKAWLTWATGRSGALLVLAIARSGTAIDGAHVLRVGPLDDASIALLVEATTDPSRAAEVCARSGGNPLFALALAGTSAGELPASVQHAAAGTLARLDATTVDVVRAGAVLDATFDVDLLAGVMQLPAVDVIDRLERAMEMGLLVERGAGFAFRHALMRDAVAATASAARAALVHREAARVLDERPQRDALRVAVHANLGGAHDLAARAFCDAAEVSFHRADVVAAEAQLRASLRALDSADAHRALARVLMATQRLDEAADEAARAIARDGAPEALEIAGWVEYYRRSYASAQRFADEAAARAASGSPIHASALALGGRVRHGTGDIADAEHCLVGALQGPREVRSVAEVWLGQVRVHEGRPLEALALIDHALVDPEHIAHPFAPLHGRFGRVLALGQLGRVTDALQACASLRTAIERAGAVAARFPAIEANTRAWLLRGVGQFDAADELNRAAIERTGAPDGAGPTSEGFAEAYWVAWLDLADGRLALGDLAAASSLLATLGALDTWNGTMAWHQRHRLGLLRARFARAADARDEAAQLAHEVVVDATRRGTARYAALGHVQVALAGGDGDIDRVERSVAVLRACASLELPALLRELGAMFGIDAWTREARDRRAALSREAR